MKNQNTLIEWGKAYLCLPKNNLESHVKINEPNFFASYEYDGSSPNMCCLLQHGYGKIWLREHNAFMKKGKIKTRPSKKNANLEKNKKAQKTLKLKKETEHKIKVEQDHQNSPKLKKIHN